MLPSSSGNGHAQYLSLMAFVRGAKLTLRKSSPLRRLIVNGISESGSCASVGFGQTTRYPSSSNSRVFVAAQTSQSQKYSGSWAEAPSGSSRNTLPLPRYRKTAEHGWLKHLLTIPAPDYVPWMML
jgi:hypothetical protein